ncbi:MAG: PAS domain S-box protein [Anaerolineae bacterium]|nr:PAS domain S-box protein [Anaerolineae bacterium]
MEWQRTPYTYSLLGAAAISIALAFYTWRRRSIRGAVPLAGVMLAVAVWSASYALELASVGLTAKLFWAKLQYLGIVMIPVDTLIFALQYTGRTRWLTHRNLLLLALLPLTALLLAWTNDLHHLIWARAWLDTSGPFSALILTHGAAFWGVVVYGYCILLLGSALIFQALFRKLRLYRGQVVAVLVAVLAPLVANVLYVSGLNPFPLLDLTPLAFTLSCLAVVLGLFRFRLLDLAPVARDAVLDGMDDAVIVLDIRGRIVDLNPAAEHLTTCLAADVLGQPAAEALSALPALAQRCSGVVEGHGEITLGEGEARRIYDFRGSPLRDSRGRPIGNLIALRDITGLRRAAQAIQDSELRYRTLFDASTDAIFLETLDGRVLDCNAAACEMLGYSKKDLLKMTVADLVPEEVAQTLPDVIATELTTGGMWGEATNKRQDGQIFPVEVNTRLITIGQEQLVIAYVRDITERKRLEQQSRERRLYLESVLACAPDAIVTLDARGQVKEWNRGAEELFGYARDEAVGRKLDSLVSGCNQKAFEEATAFTQQVLEGRLVRPTETVRCRRDGTPVDVILAGAPILVEGEVAGVVAIYTDIAERKRAEKAQKKLERQREQAREALRRRNRELVLLNRVIAASAASQEIEPILETVCRELAEAFELPHAAAVLLNAERSELVVVAEHRASDRPPFLGQAIPASAMPLVRELVEHKLPVIIEDARSDPRLGRVCSLIPSHNPISLLLLPILIEGESVGFLGMAAVGAHSFLPEEVDLARRVAEQVSGALARARLAETERRLSTAVDQAAEAVVVTDAEATILYVNPAFERIVGYSRAEVIGQPLRVLDSSRLDLFFQGEMWQAEAGRQAWQERVDYLKRDGHVCNLDLAVAPVRDQAGEIVSYVATMRDVTREAQLEAEFQQAQKMEALGRLAGGVAHDFNNLLTIIKGSAQLLDLKLLPGDPLRHHTRPIQETVDRAVMLTRQLVSFSRGEVIRPSVLDLNQMVSDLSSMFRRVIGEDIQLVTVLAGDLWPIEADPAKIDQVIANLVVNARDAMPRGGALTIETANVTFDQAYAEQHVEAQAGDYVRLMVSDTGMGMDDSVKARIFEPFFTTKEKGQGSGLGLATVFGIVTQSGGRIEVDSEVGRGTTFRIYLPRVLEGQPMPEALPHTLPLVPGRLMRGTETVLVVEDDPSVRDLAVRVLRSCGYQVLAAGDGLEALQIGERYDGPIHLLLSDVVLPYLRGDELVSKLLRVRREMRVLYMSGHTDGAIAQQGVQKSGLFFLPKPFSIKDLTRSVREALDDKH